MPKPRLPRFRLLGKVAGLSVYLVSGEHVRDQIDVDFTMGGNEGAYPHYVPPGEIWIDDAMHPLDRTATALHEIVERDLMLHHDMSYDRAHDAANVRERAFRQGLVHHHPKTFDGRRVAFAYRVYLRSRSLGASGASGKSSRQLDHEIAETLGRRR